MVARNIGSAGLERHWRCVAVSMAGKNEPTFKQGSSVQLDACDGAV